MGAHTGDRLEPGIGPVDESADRTEVERERSAVRQVDACADRPPGTGVGLQDPVGGWSG
jgi:hypothetical protein